MDNKVKQIIHAERRRHSQKPLVTYELIERIVGDGKIKVELFARNTKEGWISLGNGIDGMDIRTALEQLNVRGI